MPSSNEKSNQFQAPLTYRHTRSSPSGYQPPIVPGSKAEIAIPIVTTSRIMDRDPIRNRSRGRWNIHREKLDHYWKLYLQDPFHSIIHMRFSKVVTGLSIVFLIVIICFAILFRSVDHVECKTGITNFTQAFAFSVSTLFTIGFGTNGGDIFFGDCIWMQTLITFESLWGILLNAIAIGLIFARFARAQSRANTIILSQCASVRRIRGELYFMIQVCEMRKHQLVEAHVRMYTVRHDYEQGKHYYFQSYPMRIQHPDDDKGALLLLALPSVVVHRLDAWSPLVRPKRDICGLHHNPAVNYLFPEPLARASDAECGDRDGTVLVQRNHICNACHCHMLPSGEKPKLSSVEPSTHQAAIEDLIKYWEESQLEVIVLVEGIDAVTSATIQVRHSYKASEILVDHGFVNCVDIHPETGGAVIDFNKFHQMEPVDPDCRHVRGGFY